jgi:zinc protease
MNSYAARERVFSRFALATLTVALGACAPAAQPGTAPGGPMAEGGSRSAPPPSLASRPLEFPGFRETQLANGMSVVIVEQAVQPIASVSLYVRSGAAVDPAAQIGRAEMTANLLTKGTTTRTANQISEAIEGIGGSLSAGAGSDWVTVSATVLAEHLPLAFELLSDVALNPTFPEDELELARRRTLSGLQAALAQPGELARRRFIREVYGPQHPYGTAPTMGTVQAIQRDDLIRFHREHFSAGNAMLVVAGAIGADDVERLARQHFGAWQAGARPALTWTAPPPREQTRIYLVHRPGTVQSNILIGHLGIRPDNPDFFPLQVLNRIVGGGTDARLFQILREEKGWTYGAYSRLTRPMDVGFFQASAEVRTEVTDSAVAEMLLQLRRVREEAVPAAEFESARAFLAGSFPLRIETPGQIASQIAQARLLGLPIEDVTRYRERIMAVTPQDVQRVARDYILPERAAVVVVGDARHIRAGLEAIAPVVLYDAEGEPLEMPSAAR